MKIKVLTFHREVNYGANLQAYALRHYLVSLGHEVSFIDFRRTRRGGFFIGVGRQWIGKSLPSTLHKIRAQVGAVEYRRSCKPMFVRFQEQFIPATPRAYFSPQSLRKTPPDANWYIVGSDQVWSPKIVADRDWPIYFLDFGHPYVKKLAYSVSSGGEQFPKGLRPRVAKYLECFEGVGVRELSLGEHLAELGFSGAQWTPDPTVLVDWGLHLGLASVERGSEVGVFFLNKSSYDKVSVGTKCWRANSLAIEGQVIDFSKKSIGPLEWVKEIAAKRVLVTDSFHAVLFALYAQTPFIFVRWGVGHNRDHRIVSFLEKMDLGSRAVNTIDLTKSSVTDALSVDWSTVSAEIRRMRLVAERFLKAHLQ